ncbi:hypothetical protein HAX54_010679, partial [Datura stramonium]|nr:hypothetical protein [Datura stramonium]
ADRWHVTCESPVLTGEMPADAQVRGLMLQATTQHSQFAGTLWIMNSENSSVALEGYKFNTDNCPDLRLNCVSRFATCGLPLESPMIQMFSFNVSNCFSNNP